MHSLPVLSGVRMIRMRSDPISFVILFYMLHCHTLLLLFLYSRVIHTCIPSHTCSTIPLQASTNADWHTLALSCILWHSVVIPDNPSHTLPLPLTPWHSLSPWHSESPVHQSPGSPCISNSSSGERKIKFSTVSCGSSSFLPWTGQYLWEWNTPPVLRL